MMNNGGFEESRPLVAEIALTASLSFIMLTAIGGNLMVFIAISRTTYLRVQVASVFITNLAIADLGCAVLVMPFSLVSVWQSQWVFSSFWCDAVCFLNYCFVITSMLTLALISVDRHIKVVYPLKYDIIMTSGRAVLLALMTWVVAFAFALPPSGVGWVQYDDNEIICATDWETDDGKESVIAYTTCAFLICFFSPIVVMVYSYWGIFKVARRNNARVIPIVLVTKMSETSLRCDSQSRTDAQPHEEGGNSQRQLSVAEAGQFPRQNSIHVASTSGTSSSEKKYSTKAIKPILTMITIYLICNTPFSITKLIKVVMADNEAVPSYMSTLASWMAFLNPACNPIIYSTMREDFQSAFSRILPRCFRRGRHSSIRSEQDPSLQASGLVGAISMTSLGLTMYNHSPIVVTEVVSSNQRR